MRKLLTKLGKMLLAIIMLLIFIGFGFEKIMKRHVSTNYPAPGTLVNLEGHRLHVYITGQVTNNPTIILEAGQGGFSTSWTHVQRLLSQETQVVSYDRAGYGWSESDNQSSDFIRNSQQLHSALESLDISPPFILVGHSLGGIFARVFADQYPDDVVGIVLVDPTPPRIFENLPDEIVARQQSVTTMMQGLEIMSHLGLLRILNPLTAFVDDMPENDRKATIGLSSSPAYIAAYLAENEIVMALPDSMHLQQDTIDVPLTILSSNQAPDGQTISQDIFETTHQLHQQWSYQSSQGQWFILDGSNHFSIILKEENAIQVVNIIEDMLRQVSE